MKANKKIVMARVIVGMGLVLGTLIGNNAYTQDLQVNPSSGPEKPKIFLDGKEVNEIPDEVFADVSFDKDEKSGCISAVHLDTIEESFNFKPKKLEIKLRKRTLEYPIESNTISSRIEGYHYWHPFQGKVELGKHPKVNCITKVERKIYYLDLVGATLNNLNEKIPSIEELKKNGRSFVYLTQLHEDLGKQEGCSKYLNIPAIAERIQSRKMESPNQVFSKVIDTSIDHTIDSKNIIAPRSQLQWLSQIIKKNNDGIVSRVDATYYFIGCEYFVEKYPNNNGHRSISKIDESKSSKTQLVTIFEEYFISPDNNTYGQLKGIAAPLVRPYLYHPKAKTIFSMDQKKSPPSAGIETLDKVIEIPSEVDSCAPGYVPSTSRYSYRWYWGENVQSIPNIYPGVLSEIEKLERHLNGHQILPEFEPFISQYPHNFRMNGCPINFQQPTSGSCKSCKQEGAIEGSDRILPIGGKRSMNPEEEEKRTTETGI